MREMPDWLFELIRSGFFTWVLWGVAVVWFIWAINKSISDASWRRKNGYLSGPFQGR